MRNNNPYYDDGHFQDDMPEEEQYYNNTHNQNQGPGGEPGQPEQEMPEEERFFKDFTHPDIDSKDPSLGNNLIKIYEEEIPFELRYETDNLTEEDKSVFKSLICKVLSTDEMSEQVNIKIEIASDSDLYFYYKTEINSSLFDKIKEEQKLTCDFMNFSDLLIKYFDLCLNNTKSYLAVLSIKTDKNAKMELMENLDYKFVELINLDFSPASQEVISKQICYRYNSMRAVQDLMQNRIDIINNVLREMDPQLISDVKTAIKKSNEEKVIEPKKEKEDEKEKEKEKENNKSIKNSRNDTNK